MYDPLFADEKWIHNNLEMMREKIETGLKAQKMGQGWNNVAPSIWKMEVVDRKSLYGYYADDVHFVKLYCKQYSDIQKICTLLTDVGIFGDGVMQCYEAHIPPLLQFLQDFNLYGMNWMHISALTWRRPLPPAVHDEKDSDGEGSDNDENAHSENDIEDSRYKRVTEVTAGEWKVWDSGDDYDREINSKYDELCPSELLQRALRQQPAHLTDDLTPSFFNSQTSEETRQLNATRQRNDSTTNRIMKDFNQPKYPVKNSCCELEADVHCSAILNAKGLEHSSSNDDASELSRSTERTINMSGSTDTLPSHVMKMNHIKSLTALWDEERARRIRRGLPQDEFNTPPFTDSTHRTLQDCEVEYRNRFTALITKGIMIHELQKDSDEVIEDKSSLESGHIGTAGNIHFESQFAMTAMDFTQNISTLPLTIGHNTSTSPFEQDHQSDDEDEDEDNVDSENDDEMEQKIMERMKQRGEARLSRDNPRYREERSLVMTQRDIADILSLSQEDGIDESHGKFLGDIAEEEYLKQPVVNSHEKEEEEMLMNLASNNNFGISSSSSSSSFQKPPTVFNPRIPTISSQPKSKSSLTEVLISNGESGRSSRREKRSPSLSQQQHQRQQNGEEKGFGSETIAKRPKKSKKDHCYTASPESPLAQQSVASKAVHTIISSSDASSSQHSSQSSAGHYLSPYTSMLLKTSHTLQKGFFSPLRLVPTYKPPQYESLLAESTKAPLQPAAIYLNKTTKESKLLNQSTERQDIKLNYNKNRCLVPTFVPPSFEDINNATEQHTLKNNKFAKHITRMVSQIADPTQTTDSNGNSDLHDMKRTGSTQKQRNGDKYRYKNRSIITSMTVELFCNSDKDFVPNPDHDAIIAFAWVSDVRVSDSEHEETNRRSGLVVCPMLAFTSEDCEYNNHSRLRENSIFKCSRLQNSVEFMVVDNELALLDALIDLVTVQMDPDYLLAYEVQKASFGYLEMRGKILGLNVLHMLGRFPLESADKRNEANNEFNKYAEDHDSGIWISGRSVLNLWRVMGGELKLQSFDLGYVVEFALNRRMPHYSNRLLKKWFKDDRKRGRVYAHLYQLAEVNMQMMDKLDILRRSSEYARLYGIDFYSVLTRGSQFRVEACLIRIAHSQGYIAASGTKLQVSRQAGLECQALVMEPESGFYEDPIVVLDFQSLYPSMMIAYNLCYSTIIGKLRRGTAGDITSGQLGFIPYAEDVSAANAMKFQDDAYIAPNGSVFCPISCREGILPMMLKELLATRQMIKRSMKMYKDENPSSVLHRVLDARQYALKMLSNVTYGYTTSSFSGRMPMAELADAIVQCGRSTLLWTKNLIEQDKSWKARVVYGDSVASYTPVYIRVDGQIHITEINRLSHFSKTDWISCIENGKEEKEYCELENVETWSENGWTQLNRVIRHQLAPHKKMHRILTHTGVVDVTDDHSLLTVDGDEISPKDVQIGTELLHETMVNNTSVDSNDMDVFKAMIYGFFFGDGSCGIYNCPTGKKSTWASNDSNERILSKYLDLCEKCYPEYKWEIYNTLNSSGLYKLTFHCKEYGEKLQFIQKYREYIYVDKMKVIPDFIMNGNQEIRVAFWEGVYDADGYKDERGCVRIDQKSQLSSAQLCWLATSIGYKTSLNIRKDKPDIYKITTTKGCLRKNPNAIKKMVEIDYNGYVYDLTTENHHFAAGIGNMIVHNTDSVFVLLKGRSKDEAFAIGEQIANKITSLSPAAVVLKMEKVYTRSFLVTKKRYVGYSYESSKQEEASYDAKGIETERRDNIPATQKLQEKCIRLYFKTLDIREVKGYLMAQWTKIQTGVSTKLTIQDFIFNKAVKWGKYKSDSSSPPGAIVSLKKIHDGDKMAEPPYGWRVPYVVVWGQPGAILRDLVVSPDVVLSRGNDLSINHTYYITKVINPAIHRVFRLCGVDINEWYLSTPRPKKRLRMYHYHNEIHDVVVNNGSEKVRGDGSGPKQQSITKFCKSTTCEGCGKDSNNYLCVKCLEDGDVINSVIFQLNEASKKERALSLICQNCTKFPQSATIGVYGKGEMVGIENCSSLACPVFYERCRIILRIEDLQVASQEAESLRRTNDSSDSNNNFDRNHSFSIGIGW